MFQPRWRWPALAGLAFLVATVSLSLPANPDAFAFVDNLRYFTVFFGTGVLGYLVRKDLRINAVVLVPLFVLFVVSVRTPFAEVGAALFLGYAALYAATLTWGPLRPLCNRFDTSFGIYIGAGPIQQTLLWLIPALTPLWLSLLGFRNRIADRVSVVDRHREAGAAPETDRRRAAEEASTGRRAAGLSCS